MWWLDIIGISDPVQVETRPYNSSVREFIMMESDITSDGLGRVLYPTYLIILMWLMGDSSHCHEDFRLTKLSCNSTMTFYKVS